MNWCGNSKGYWLSIGSGECRYCPVLINEWSGLMIAEGRQIGRLKHTEIGYARDGEEGKGGCRSNLSLRLSHFWVCWLTTWLHMRRVMRRQRGREKEGKNCLTERGRVGSREAEMYSWLQTDSQYCLRGIHFLRLFVQKYCLSIDKKW